MIFLRKSILWRPESLNILQRNFYGDLSDLYFEAKEIYMSFIIFVG